MMIDIFYFCVIWIYLFWKNVCTSLTLVREISLTLERYTS